MCNLQKTEQDSDCPIESMLEAEYRSRESIALTCEYNNQSNKEDL